MAVTTRSAAPEHNELGEMASVVPTAVAGPEHSAEWALAEPARAVSAQAEPALAVPALLEQAVEARAAPTARVR